MVTPHLHFGLYLKLRREAAGLTRHAVAQACGVHPSRVTRWEQGEYFPSSAARVVLVRVLDLDLMQLHAAECADVAT